MSEAQKRTQFKPGQSGNPSGKKIGTRDKFSKAFFKDMLKDWLKNGIEVIETVRIKDPSTYLKIMASMITKEDSSTTINVKNECAQCSQSKLTVDEINQATKKLLMHDHAT